MRENIKRIIIKIIDFLKHKFSRKNEEFVYYLLILFALIVFVVGINFFVELTEELPGKALKNFDRQITEFVISFRSEALNGFFRFVTDLGDVYAYIVATVIAAMFFLWKFRHWDFVLQLVGVIITAGLSNIALKKVIDRARPTIDHLVVVESLSYPSGHAMSAMAFYGFLIYLCFQIKMSNWLRGFLSFLFVLLIFSIGLSRIYLGVHFPSDVLGGFIAGLIWIAFCIVLFNIIYLWRRSKRRKEFTEEEKNLEN